MKITHRLSLHFFTFVLIIISYLLFPPSVDAEDLNCYDYQNETLILSYDELYLEAGTDLVIHISRGSDSEIDCDNKTVYVCLEPNVFDGKFVCEDEIPITLDTDCSGLATAPSPLYKGTYDSVVLDGYTYGINNYCSGYVDFETYGGGHPPQDCLTAGGDCCLDELGWCLKPGASCCNVCPGYYCGFNGKVYPNGETTCGYLNTSCCLDDGGKVAGTPCFGDFIPSDISNPSTCTCEKVPEPLDIKLTCTTSDGKRGINSAIGCIPINANTDFLRFLLQWGMGVAGGFAVLLILYASFIFITSSGDKYKIKAGRELLTAAITGILFLIFSVFLLRVIGIDILGITQLLP